MTIYLRYTLQTTSIYIQIHMYVHSTSIQCNVTYNHYLSVDGLAILHIAVNYNYSQTNHYMCTYKY